MSTTLDLFIIFFSDEDEKKEYKSFRSFLDREKQKQQDRGAKRVEGGDKTT